MVAIFLSDNQSWAHTQRTWKLSVLFITSPTIVVPIWISAGGARKILSLFALRKKAHYKKNVTPWENIVSSIGYTSVRVCIYISRNIGFGSRPLKRNWIWMLLRRFFFYVRIGSRCIDLPGVFFFFLVYEWHARVFFVKNSYEAL